jgi:hypothetical protein
MNLIDKDALIEALGIETDCYGCEHERLKYHCDLDPVEACTKIVEAPVVTVTTESAEKAIEVLKNAACLGVVYSFEETEEAVKTAIRALQMVSNQYADVSKKVDLISRADAVDAISKIKRTDNWQAAVSMALLDLPSAQPETNCSEFPNNSDTISRQAAIDALDKRFDSIPMEQTTEILLLRKDLRDLPSAQPEIIHCRECKHWREGDAYSYCDKLFSMGVLDVYDYMTSEDDFCSNAERGTDAETEV